MNIAGSNRRSRNVFPGLLAAGLLVTGLSSPVPARADCLVSYADCVDAASELDTFWKRSAEGISCFLDLVDCLQGRLG